MAIFNLKRAALVAAYLVGNVLAAPSPAEPTFTAVTSNAEPAPTPLNLPTSLDTLVIVDDGGPPPPVNGTGLLPRQATPGLRLMNCWPVMWGNGNGPWTYASVVVWCNDMNDCNRSTYQASGNDVCIMKETTTVNDYHIWEGSQQSCTFPSGVTFTWNIPWNAQTFPNYGYVGSGSNGYQSFSGYKDDHGTGPQTFTPPSRLHSCSKIYWYW